MKPACKILATIAVLGLLNLILTGPARASSSDCIQVFQALSGMEHRIGRYETQGANFLGYAKASFKDQEIDSAQALKMIQEEGFESMIAGAGAVIRGARFEPVFTTDPLTFIESEADHLFMLVDPSEDSKIAAGPISLGQVGEKSYAVMRQKGDQVLVELHLKVRREWQEDSLGSWYPVTRVEYDDSTRFIVFTPN